MAGIPSALFFLIVFVIIVAASAIKIVREYERGVIFRLGRLIGAKGPGIFFIIPGVDKLLRISLRTIALEIPTQEVITRDNVSLRVNAVVYFRVIDPNKAVVEIENYLYATSQLAQTTLRSVIGQSLLDEL
jgi:regulator of protease activity HflC (stomatin/prohibitin superfamily)